MKITTQYEILKAVHLGRKIRRVKSLRVFLYILANKYQELNSLLRYGTTDMFIDFDIETITTCNRRCSYCPNSIFERSLPKNEKLMDKELFEKIIDELAEIW
jgi:sulfatase maturation enzyme AslB (radical SAM superfamily)